MTDVAVCALDVLDRQCNADIKVKQKVVGLR